MQIHLHKTQSTQRNTKRPQSFYLAENIRINCLQGTKPPQSYYFCLIYSRVRTKITQSYSFRSIYPRVHTKIAPKQIHIHNTQSTQRTTRRPQCFYRRKDNKNVHQPLCIDYPNITAGIRKLTAITYIK